MRFVTSTIVFLIVSLAVGKTSGMGQPPAPPPKITVLTTELRTKILDAMRLNRRAFQEKTILDRYGEQRPPASDAAFVMCDLPRTSAGEPASQYPAAKARTTEHTYPETAVVDCLETTGGLA